MSNVCVEHLRAEMSEKAPKARVVVNIRAGRVFARSVVVSKVHCLLLASSFLCEGSLPAASSDPASAYSWSPNPNLTAFTFTRFTSLAGRHRVALPFYKMS